jgi:hypothetical protein
VLALACVTGAAILAVAFLRHVAAKAELEGQKDVDGFDTHCIEFDELEAENAV